MRQHNLILSQNWKECWRILPPGAPLLSISLAIRRGCQRQVSIQNTRGYAASAQANLLSAPRLISEMSGQARASRSGDHPRCYPRDLIIPPWRAGHGRLPTLKPGRGCSSAWMDGWMDVFVAAFRGRLEEGKGSGFSLACQSGTGHTVRSLAGDRGVPRGLRGVRWNADGSRRYRSATEQK